MMSKNKYLDIFYQNVRGLRTKTETFYNNLALSSTDIAMITESWLCDGILNSELACPSHYDIFRRDRGSLGGGVMIACATKLCARARPDLDREDIECIWITIPRRSLNILQDIHVACIYLPPDSLLSLRLHKFITIFKSVIETYPNDYFILGGDFNLPCLDWTANPLKVLKKCSVEVQEASYELINIMAYFNFTQYNFIKNVSNNILDLFFSNVLIEVTKPNFSLVTEDNYHPPLEIRLCDIMVPHIKRNFKTKMLFYKCDYNVLNEYLLKQDWSFISSAINIQNIIEIFYQTLNSAISIHVPCKVINKQYKYPPWYNSAIINIIKEKNKYHRLWKKYNNPIDYDSFSLLRSRLKKQVQKGYQRYIEASQAQIKINPKLLWTYINAKRANVSNYPAEMQYKSHKFCNEMDICNAFNNFFQENFSPPLVQYNLSKISNVCCIDNISSVHIAIDDMKKLLKSLDCSKGAGSDCIPPIFFAKTTQSLADPLCRIFNICFDIGYFPEVWKTANIVPIHKKGTKLLIDNYRPISILNVLSKVMERIVHNNIYPLIVSNVPSQQHGFIKGRSTNTNLGIFVSDVFEGMNDGCQVDVVYTDFSKAFDRVDHVILLYKLQVLGIHGNLLRWMESYLRNRSQAVVMAGHRSDYVSVPSGVPQGSILGPLLYAAYLFDVNNCFHFAKFLMYADDTKIYAKIKDINDALSLQDDLNRLCSYYRQNRIDINVSKCSQISFTRKKITLNYEYHLDNITIKRGEQIKDLGIVFDSKMTMIDHISLIITKAYKNLGFVLRVSKPFSDVNCIKLLYYSYVRSILEYCCNIWDPYYITHTQNIEKIQIKFLKHLDFKANHTRIGYSESCKFHNLDTLYNRRLLLNMMFLYDVINNKIDSPELTSLFVNLNAPNKRTRHTVLFSCPPSHSNYCYNSLVPRTLRTYNKKFSDNCDIFYDGKTSFKKVIIYTLNNS